MENQTDIEYIEPILRYKDSFANHRLMYQNDIGIITGFPKSGKSTLLIALTSAFIKQASPEKNLGFSSRLQFIDDEYELQKRVLYFDTQKSTKEFEKQIELIYRQAEMDFKDNRLFYLDVAPLTPELRLNQIKHELAKENVKLLIIDGIEGLVSDINNAVEVNALLKYLKTLKGDVSIICTIGQNLKIGTPYGPAGELGKKLLEACSFCLKMERVGVNSKVVFKKLAYDPLGFKFKIKDKSE